ncbi:hypothetical protein T12_2299 [Trichinella patagoniensis]|uniref:Uncharacterized protein n=1 Tax=Trichinella patagoniensis TaxID=990121 RepID=A0A0V0YSD1_9BILA|nr:hypothetical protein T12_2299 [Trichinella patagoniensis]
MVLRLSSVFCVRQLLADERNNYYCTHSIQQYHGESEIFCLLKF